jgi:hypothetical protein
MRNCIHAHEASMQYVQNQKQVFSRQKTVLSRKTMELHYKIYDSYIVCMANRQKAPEFVILPPFCYQLILRLGLRLRTAHYFVRHSSIA